jgi:hypothetical protein
LGNWVGISLWPWIKWFHRRSKLLQVKSVDLIKPKPHLGKCMCKCDSIYALARALVMLAWNLVIFPNVQLELKYVCIYACIHASDNLALAYRWGGPKIISMVLQNNWMAPTVALNNEIFFQLWYGPCQISLLVLSICVCCHFSHNCVWQHCREMWILSLFCLQCHTNR